MKTIIFFTVFYSLIFSVHAGNGPVKDYSATTSICAILDGEIGLKSKSCKGFGLSCMSLEVDINIVNNNDNAYVPPAGKLKVCFFMPSSTTIQINFTPEAGERVREFIVEKQTTVCAKLAQSFGYRSITIPQGIYPVKWESNGTVTATLRTISR